MRGQKAWRLEPVDQTESGLSTGPDGTNLDSLPHDDLPKLGRPGEEGGDGFDRVKTLRKTKALTPGRFK
jgi:hypothetical protein